MAKKYDCTLLVNSCDKYEDILDTFFELLHRFWPDLPFEIALTTETLNYKNKYFKIKNIHPIDKNCTWTERISEALKEIKSNYVLLMLDDLFLYDFVQTSKVLENLKALEENQNIVNFTYWPILNDTEESIYSGFKKRKKDAKYKVAAIIALWNKKQFLKYVEGYKENIWEFEPNATNRSNTIYKNDEFYISKDFPKQVFPYNFAKYGLFSGKWLKDTKELFKSLNIDFNFKKRGFYNPKERGLTKSFISSFKLDSYLIPNYNLKKSQPCLKYHQQKEENFVQKYNIKGATNMVYWCLTDQCGFGVKNLSIDVVYADKSNERISHKNIFGSFKKIGNTFVFNAGQPNMYIKTNPEKIMKTIEIKGNLQVPVSKLKLSLAYDKKTIPKNNELQRLKQNIEREFMLVEEIISCITLNPNMHYYLNDKYCDDILESSEENTSNTFKHIFMLKEDVKKVVWEPSIHAGFSIENLDISYEDKNGKNKKISMKSITGLPQCINKQYIFVEPPHIEINISDEDYKKIIISGKLNYPVNNEILNCVLAEK